jgi:hypothetical protein
MAFERASKGNVEGVEATVKELDPLERHIFMIPKSWIKELEKMVFEAEDKTNKSKLVREALAKKYKFS